MKIVSEILPADSSIFYSFIRPCNKF